MLLNNTSFANRKLMALVIKTEEREVIESCLQTLEGWKNALVEKLEAYVPPDHDANYRNGILEA